MEEGNLKFFSRVKIAVTKLENYNIFLEEKTKVAVKYFFTLVFLLSIVFALVQTYKIAEIINKGDYSLIFENYETENLDLDKEQLIEKIEEIGVVGVSVTIFLVLIISVYIVNIIATYIDWLMISIFAYVTSKICKINISFKQSYNISIYALTLSIILSMIYQVVYLLTDFYMQYFRTMYLLISYVYVVAVILMIKSDLIKQQIEVSKIVEIQEEVHKELENKKKEKTKEEPEDKEKEKDKKEDGENIPGQPEAE